MTSFYDFSYPCGNLLCPPAGAFFRPLRFDEQTAHTAVLLFPNPINAKRPEGVGPAQVPMDPAPFGTVWNQLTTDRNRSAIRIAWGRTQLTHRSVRREDRQGVVNERVTR